MGLDMYLTAKEYYGRWDYKHQGEPLERAAFKQIADASPDLRAIMDNESAVGIQVEVTVAYWRKANAIHKWFVDHCQNGVDDCGHYAVSGEQLKKLLDLCEAVMGLARRKDGIVRNGRIITRGEGGEVQAKDILEPGVVVENDAEMAQLLPTQGGFFFGSTDYDEVYLQDVEHTIKRLKVLEPHFDRYSFYYHSSW